MIVDIEKITDRKGNVINKFCVKDNRMCANEKTSVCNGCSVFAGKGDKPVLFN